MTTISIWWLFESGTGLLAAAIPRLTNNRPGREDYLNMSDDCVGLKLSIERLHFITYVVGCFLLGRRCVNGNDQRRALLNKFLTITWVANSA